MGAIADAGVPEAAMHIMLNTTAATTADAGISVLNRFATLGKAAQHHLSNMAGLDS